MRRLAKDRPRSRRGGGVARGAEDGIVAVEDWQSGRRRLAE
jgi:hypothetical protein